ncbi:toxin-antitoxin system YwqK family antitoxin [Janthinobacterium sp. NKUCC08_JDC]|uniref:toxin-antitoxin system YwqK family antitoxin n=1 Tax=Janthinobacterium sp. NKUCC08_JDC TaxID=2842122 RepID=UPI001C5B0A45|nr:hypothetical protein [Janthinobacterium sp. NKUCC08_JDC]MBW3502426.1 hypothetical protein [Janthinobacterium sp. NKUCC08_JDC]
MFRIDYEELNPSDDFLVMHYDGKPFTGIAFENDENGVLVTETGFIEGQKNGVSREWSNSGDLIREEWFALNSLHGPSREWHDNGSIKIDSLYELGICINKKEWDKNGNIIKNYQIDEGGPQFSTLKKLRSSNIGLIVSNSNFPE